MYLVCKYVCSSNKGTDNYDLLIIITTKHLSNHVDKILGSTSAHSLRTCRIAKVPVMHTVERESWQRNVDRSSLMSSVLDAKYTGARNEILDLKEQKQQLQAIIDAAAAAAAKEVRRLAYEKALKEHRERHGSRGRDGVLTIPVPKLEPDPNLVPEPVDDQAQYWELVRSLANQRVGKASLDVADAEKLEQLKIRMDAHGV